MKKQKSADKDKKVRGSKDFCFVNDQNGIGIEYWPPEVLDELNRVHPKGNYFIPDEELLMADLRGKPLFNPWDLLGANFVSPTRNDAVLSSLDGEQDAEDKEADEILRQLELREAAEAQRMAMNDLPMEVDNHPLAEIEEALEHIRLMYPRLFSGRNLADSRLEALRLTVSRLSDEEQIVSFHGGTCRVLPRGDKLAERGMRRGHRASHHRRTDENTKRNKREHWDTRDAGRIASFEQRVAEDEFHVTIHELEMSRQFDRKLDRREQRK